MAAASKEEVVLVRADLRLVIFHPFHEGVEDRVMEVEAVVRTGLLCMEVEGLCGNTYGVSTQGCRVFTQASKLAFKPLSAASWMRTQRLWQSTLVLSSLLLAMKCLVYRCVP